MTCLVGALRYTRYALRGGGWAGGAGGEIGGTKKRGSGEKEKTEEVRESKKKMAKKAKGRLQIATRESAHAFARSPEGTGEGRGW